MGIFFGLMVVRFGVLGLFGFVGSVLAGFGVGCTEGSLPFPSCKEASEGLELM